MTTLLEASTRSDLIIPSDTARTLSFVFVDENDNAIDYTGSTFSLVIKARDANDNPTGSALHTLTTGSGIAGDVSLGEFQPTFPKSSAWSTPSVAGAYIYEVLRLVAAAPIEPVLVGKIDIVTGLS